MLSFRQKRRAEDAIHPVNGFAALKETELVLKLKKEELFDPHVLLPHSELNSIVYERVNAFVEKYKGTEMTLLIYTDPVNVMIQDSFREVYVSHYREEIVKVNRYLKHYFNRSLALIVIGIVALLVGISLSNRYSTETVLSYIILNLSAFCLWETGYTQFSARTVMREKKRILRALNARIEFQ